MTNFLKDRNMSDLWFKTCLKLAKMYLQEGQADRFKQVIKKIKLEN